VTRDAAKTRNARAQTGVETLCDAVIDSIEAHTSQWREIRALNYAIASLFRLPRAR
jgi:hypothetical protein